MVLPPNRIGGARGPDGRTLTDLYNLLVALSAPDGLLTAIAQNTLATRVALESLLGFQNGAPPVVPDWQGIVRYLSTYVSPLGPNNFGPRDIRQWLTLVEEELADIRNALRSQGGTGTSLVFLLLEAIEDLRSSPSDSLRQIVDVLDALNNTQGSSGAGLTIYELLEQVSSNTLRSAECCEEGGGGELPAQFPTGYCLTEAEAYRVVAWNRLQTSNPGAVTSYNIWAADFGDLSGIGLTRQVDTLGAVYYRYPQGGPLGATAELCAVWDFTTATQPGVQRLGAGEGTPEQGSPGLPQGNQEGGVEASITAAPSGQPQFYLRFTVDYGGQTSSAPGLNAWIGPTSVG